jgi:ketosteroid isomerase-like protein
VETLAPRGNGSRHDVFIRTNLGFPFRMNAAANLAPYLKSRAAVARRDFRQRAVPESMRKGKRGRSSTEWAHPEIEYVVADGPAPGRWTGLAGMAEAWRELLSAWEAWRGEADEYCELDGERVLVLFHFSGRGKASGLELGHMRTKAASLFHLRGGKVTRLVLYAEAEHALADLGLAPEAGPPRS